MAPVATLFTVLVLLADVAEGGSNASWPNAWWPSGGFLGGLLGNVPGPAFGSLVAVQWQVDLSTFYGGISDLVLTDSGTAVLLSYVRELPPAVDHVVAVGIESASGRIAWTRDLSSFTCLAGLSPNVYVAHNFVLIVCIGDYTYPVNTTVETLVLDGSTGEPVWGGPMSYNTSSEIVFVQLLGGSVFAFFGGDGSVGSFDVADASYLPRLPRETCLISKRQYYNNYVTTVVSVPFADGSGFACAAFPSSSRGYGLGISVVSARGNWAVVASLKDQFPPFYFLILSLTLLPPIDETPFRDGANVTGPGTLVAFISVDSYYAFFSYDPATLAFTRNLTVLTVMGSYMQIYQGPIAPLAAPDGRCAWMAVQESYGSRQVSVLVINTSDPSRSSVTPWPSACTFTPNTQPFWAIDALGTAFFRCYDGSSSSQIWYSVSSQVDARDTTLVFSSMLRWGSYQSTSVAVGPSAGNLIVASVFPGPTTGSVQRLALLNATKRGATRPFTTCFCT